MCCTLACYISFYKKKLATKQPAIQIFSVQIKTILPYSVSKTYISVKNSFRLLQKTCFHKPDSIDKFFHSPHMPDPKQHCCLHNIVSNIMLKNKKTIQWVLTEKMVC